MKLTEALTPTGISQSIYFESNYRSVVQNLQHICLDMSRFDYNDANRIYSAGHQHPPSLSLKRIFGGFFVPELQPYNKPALSIDEQIDLLVQRGMANLYTYLCMVQCLMLKNNPHSNWKARLHALMAKQADVPQEKMGFPPDWQDDAFWKATVARGQT